MHVVLLLMLITNIIKTINKNGKSYCNLVFICSVLFCISLSQISLTGTGHCIKVMISPFGDRSKLALKKKKTSMRPISCIHWLRILSQPMRSYTDGESESVWLRMRDVWAQRDAAFPFFCSAAADHTPPICGTVILGDPRRLKSGRCFDCVVCFVTLQLLLWTNEFIGFEDCRCLWKSVFITEIFFFFSWSYFWNSNLTLMTFPPNIRFIWAFVFLSTHAIIYFLKPNVNCIWYCVDYI